MLIRPEYLNEHKRRGGPYPMIRLEGSADPDYEVFIEIGLNQEQDKSWGDVEHSTHAYLSAPEAETLALAILTELHNRGKLSFKLGESYDFTDS